MPTPGEVLSTRGLFGHQYPRWMLLKKKNQKPKKDAKARPSGRYPPGSKPFFRVSELSSIMFLSVSKVEE